MLGESMKSRALILLLLPVALLGCETGRGYPEHDEVATTLQRILDGNPSMTCTEIEVLNESGAGATFRYYTARANCATSTSAGTFPPVWKHYELRYDRVPDGWKFKTLREVDRAFAEDPASRGPTPFHANPWARRLLFWIFGILTGVILFVLILWALGDRYKVLPAVARRLKLSRNKQPHQKKHFDSINPLD